MVYDDNHTQITSVQFEQWLGTDRFSIVTQVSPVDDFVVGFCNALDILKPYAHTAKQQALYFKGLKEKIAVGEILVKCDFAENYSFFIQDAAQAFHWNNEQVTLLTSAFIFYNKGSQLRHGSIVTISDDTKHDTAAGLPLPEISA